MKEIFDSTIQEILNERLTKLETHFDVDVIFYYGSIAENLEMPFRDFIEDLLMISFMKSVANKTKKVIKVETQRNSADKSFQEIYHIIEEMEKMGYAKNPKYTLPQIDTIGRKIYTSLNKCSN